MLWFTVWTVLVVGTLVGAFLLGRRLYRQGRALLAELERASELLAAVADRADELSIAAQTRSALAPVELHDPGPARARRTTTALATARRRAARAARHEDVYRRWRTFSH